MSCCQCQGIETFFSDKMAARELKRYRKKGPSKTTRMLIEALTTEGVDGKTLLDIGGGVGAIQHELMTSGVSKVTNVDASEAYIQAASEEAQRRGLADRVTYHHGDFVDLAAQMEKADLVTLDRVICCYDDMETLVGLSADRARWLYALVYPRDRWLMKSARPVANLFFRIRGNPFRIFVHPTEAVDARVRSRGLHPHVYRKTFLWQVVVYVR